MSREDERSGLKGEMMTSVPCYVRDKMKTLTLEEYIPLMINHMKKLQEECSAAKELAAQREREHELVEAANELKSSLKRILDA